MTPFEKRLAEIPLREPSAEWRAAILAPIGNRKSKIQNLLWPHPWAWGALAACWLAVAILNFSGPRGKGLYTVVPQDRWPANFDSAAYAAYVGWRNFLLAENRFSSGGTATATLDRGKL